MRYNCRAAPSGNPAGRERLSNMKEKPTPTQVVTVLAAVWYVLDIIAKIVQLLR